MQRITQQDPQMVVLMLLMLSAVMVNLPLKKMTELTVLVTHRVEPLFIHYGTDGKFGTDGINRCNIINRTRFENAADDNADRFCYFNGNRFRR